MLFIHINWHKSTNQITIMTNCLDFHREKRFSSNFSCFDYQNYASKEFVMYFQSKFLTYNSLAKDNLSLVNLWIYLWNQKSVVLQTNYILWKENRDRLLIHVNKKWLELINFFNIVKNLTTNVKFLCFCLKLLFTKELFL